MARVRNVCVVGLGLIGGSVLRAACRAGRTAWGAAASTEDVAAAAAEGFEVGEDLGAALRKAAERDALVVLAVPLTALDGVLAAVREHAPRCLLTDVISVKRPVVDRVAELAPQARYVAGHPMAGAARSGWHAAHAGLFDGAVWVVCVERHTNLELWAEVAGLALEAGAEVVPASATEHDAAVARVSHLPHLLAAVLATVGAKGGPLALALGAGSFTDGTRVAASRPELTRAMTEGNREALLTALDEALGLLGAARGALASTGSLRATIEAGHEGAMAFSAARSAERAGLRIDLTAPDAVTALQGLAQQGGRITAVDGTGATGSL
ncbi:prephenate dehydrogenase [Haloechinothrix sp. LS1_15]|uniref:prephenate dehydrogenase n=1 Tax=Haloechinothrix sp. LS1_15 TaxID=2652248 RepID=UPI0029444DD0|nr:prephenate dehydrogenase [Haloechinothrix sp. LS1_15]MDV6011253.1 prephenate dehydrogenase [Haloechinothrix sp. LS1_15]